MNSDLYLRAATALKESPAPPTPGNVVEMLLRMAHNMPEQPFVWSFIDKPRAGTSAIVYNDPSRPWPSDGIRYVHNAEQVSTTSQTFSRGPGSVELETYILTQGIYPPASAAIPLAQDTPELNLGRFRMRFRIVGGSNAGLGNPRLWYVYWGWDERVQARAPPGWEREPIRRYPLPPVNEGVQYPLRRIEGPPVANMPPQQQQPQPNMAGQGGMMPQPQPPSLGLAQSRPRSGVPPQQQQQLQQSLPPGRPNMPGPMHMSMPPAPIQQNMQPPMQMQQPSVQQIQQMQQQQQQYNNSPQMQQTPKQIMRKVQTPNGGPAGSTLPPQGMQQQQSGPTQAQIQQFQQQSMAQARTMLSTLTFPAAFNDPYEMLSDRSWAGLRYEKNHALIAPIFDACTVDELLTSWKAPSLPDIADIKTQIAEAEAEVEKLRAAMAKSNTTLEPPPASNQSGVSLARRGSVMPSVAEMPVDPLLAPLPQMISIAEMTEGAMQAHNARRAKADQIAAAAEAEQRLVREEEERIRRQEEEGRLKEEEGQRRLMEQQQQQELQAAQSNREQEDLRLQQSQQYSQNQEMQQQHQQAVQTSQQAFEQYQAQQGQAIQQESQPIQQQEEPQYGQLSDLHFGQDDHEGAGGNSIQHDFMDDAYLYANNLGNYGVGAGGEGDGMEESLFDEYFNQTTGM